MCDLLHNIYVYDEKPIVKIENWSVSYSKSANPYYPPEVVPKALCGKVYGHPKKEDGSYVRTTGVVDGEKNRVETYNTIYILGKVDPNYVEWCKQKGCHVPTKDEPIKW